MLASTIAPARVAHDPVHHAAHYRGHSGLEVRDVIRDWRLGYDLGNVVKYILSAGRKGDPRLCLRKALHYLEFAHRDILAGRPLDEWSHRGFCSIEAARVAVDFDISPALASALAAIRDLSGGPTFAAEWIKVAIAEMRRALDELDRLPAEVA